MKRNPSAIPGPGDWDGIEVKVTYSDGDIADDLPVGKYVKIEKKPNDFKVSLDSKGNQSIFERYDYHPSGMLVHPPSKKNPEFYCVIFQVPGTDPPVIASARWRTGNPIPGGTGVWGAGGGG